MTCSHKMFDPLCPDVSLIDIGDIAHSLSMLCRANGHFRRFYSVGMHSINCAREAADVLVAKVEAALEEEPRIVRVEVQGEEADA